MRILVAMDSFKGSMTSLEAGDAVRDGILSVAPEADVTVRPMADGGEGSVYAVTYGMEGEWVTVPVTGPLGDEVLASYFITEGKTAYIESASSSGITLIPQDRLDPMTATSRGLGEVIMDAVKRGAAEITVCLGGVAVNDGGSGMLKALGFKLTDSGGSEISDGALGLKNLAHIDDSAVADDIRRCRFVAASDVTNPLCGPNGASEVFAPQKGARPEDIPLMDEWMGRFADLTRDINPGSDPDKEGSGAAGGLGFALMSYLGAQRISGAELIIRKTGLEEIIKGSDIIITGEGHIDRQTVMGKTCGTVADLASRCGRKVIAIGGIVTGSADNYSQYGISEVHEVIRVEEDYMETSKACINLAFTAAELFKDRCLSM